MFNEKEKEFSKKQGKDIPVWKTPKYEQSKKKANDLINNGDYGLCEGDFWILMNETKTGKMQYTGLIISHNACLKINDKLKEKFKPSCVSVDKDGFNNSLVFTYCNDEQGIYEVGECNASNCKNEYIYAMAFKRLFDRVVLKLSRIAYDGIYSEVEADEFKQPEQEGKSEPDYNDLDIIEGMRACDNLKNLQAYFKTYYDKVHDKDQFIKLKDILKAKFKKEELL